MRKLLFIVAMCCGCTDEQTAERILEQQGYSKIQTTGYAIFGCAKDDTTQTGFVATAPNGSRVEGAVCCGLVFKNCTVRFGQ